MGEGDGEKVRGGGNREGGSVLGGRCVGKRVGCVGYKEACGGGKGVMRIAWGEECVEKGKSAWGRLERS